MRSLLVGLTVLLFVGSFSGCGGSDAVESPLKPVSSGVEKQCQTLVEGLQAAFAQEGVKGLQISLSSEIENLEYLKPDQAAAEHVETCKQIVEGVKAMHASLQGSPGEAEAKKKLDELAQLAAKLPSSSPKATNSGSGTM